MLRGRGKIPPPITPSPWRLRLRSLRSPALRFAPRLLGLRPRRKEGLHPSSLLSATRSIHPPPSVRGYSPSPRSLHSLTPPPGGYASARYARQTSPRDGDVFCSTHRRDALRPLRARLRSVTRRPPLAYSLSTSITQSTGGGRAALPLDPLPAVATLHASYVLTQRCAHLRVRLRVPSLRLTLRLARSLRLVVKRYASSKRSAHLRGRLRGPRPTAFPSASRDRCT